MGSEMCIRDSAVGLSHFAPLVTHVDPDKIGAARHATLQPVALPSWRPTPWTCRPPSPACKDHPPADTPHIFSVMTIQNACITDLACRTCWKHCGESFCDAPHRHLRDSFRSLAMCAPFRPPTLPRCKRARIRSSKWRRNPPYSLSTCAPPKSTNESLFPSSAPSRAQAAQPLLMRTYCAAPLTRITTTL